MGDATSIYSKPSISYSQVDHYRSMDRTDNNPVLTGNSMPGVSFLLFYLYRLAYGEIQRDTLM